MVCSGLLHPCNVGFHGLLMIYNWLRVVFTNNTTCCSLHTNRGSPWFVDVFWWVFLQNWYIFPRDKNEIYQRLLTYATLRSLEITTNENNPLNHKSGPIWTLKCSISSILGFPRKISIFPEISVVAINLKSILFT